LGGEDVKYCSKCKKVYPDGIDFECTREKTYSWDKPVVMIELDCEPVCKCGSTESLTYHPEYKFTTSKGSIPSYCTCAECDRKLQARIDREESMKYLILDSYQDENKFCDSKEEVEEFLKYYVEDSDRDSGPLEDVLILKLEPLTENLKESDFKPQREYTEGGFLNKQEPNTHIVIWDGEIFRVDDVMVPEIEYDGDRSINW
jgi:hypothetical protein